MRVCSLFCGIGGIDLAFTQAGHEIVWANDIDKYACMTYRHNFPDTVLVEGDIRNIDKYDIPDFDILAAGFPCQPFSVCGKQKGFSDERGNLFFEIGKVIDAKRPSIVFLENVANLIEHDHGKTFNVIHNELAGRGYFIRYLVADACDYGIPQHRTRTYIVAFSDRIACENFTFPEKVPQGTGIHRHHHPGVAGIGKNKPRVLNGNFFRLFYGGGLVHPLSGQAGGMIFLQNCRQLCIHRIKICNCIHDFIVCHIFSGSQQFPARFATSCA